MKKCDISRFSRFMFFFHIFNTLSELSFTLLYIYFVFKTNFFPILEVEFLHPFLQWSRLVHSSVNNPYNMRMVQVEKTTLHTRLVSPIQSFYHTYTNIQHLNEEEKTKSQSVPHSNSWPILLIHLIIARFNLNDWKYVAGSTTRYMLYCNYFDVPKLQLWHGNSIIVVENQNFSLGLHSYLRKWIPIKHRLPQLNKLLY